MTDCKKKQVLNPLLCAPADRPPPFAGPLSLRTALAYFADVTSPPHKDALAALSTFASDAAEAGQLSRMASHEGKGEYAEFISKPHRSLLEVRAGARARVHKCA